MQSNQEQVFSLISPEVKEQIKAFKTDMYQRYNEISKEKTPQVDGTGKKIIEKRPDGHDYIIESYMRDCLDRHFPGWSWEGEPLYFLGSEWVVAQGHLVIIDEHLLAFHINPPVRKFFGVDSVRIQYKKNSDHIPINVVDVGDNCKQANTAALKYAINRLTHIGDDVYGKRVEEEGAGSYETILEAKGESNTFLLLLNKNKILPSEACRILGVEALTEVEDFAEAWAKIKEAKRIK